MRKCVGTLGLAVGVLTLLAIGACGGDDEPEVAPAALGEACGRVACGNGLTCSAGSRIAGTCTAECENDTECQVRFGNSSECTDGFCVLMCQSDDDCPTGGCHEQIESCVTSGACTARGRPCADKDCCGEHQCARSSTGAVTCCLPSGGPNFCWSESECCAPSQCVQLGNSSGRSCMVLTGSPCTADDTCYDQADESIGTCTNGVCVPYSL